MTDPLSLLSRAVDQVADVVAGIRPEQADLPTPCRSWNVRELVVHVVQELGPFTAAARGEQPDWSAPGPRVGDDWAGEFRTGADALLAAWGKADLTGTADLPGLGEVPARVPVDMQIAEFAAHAWDLARATGQSTDLDPEVAEVALAFMRTTLAPRFRGSEADGKSFGPEVPIADDAPPYERLAAFSGRHPDAGQRAG
jgi:uncharacterized protein (TIGR03086 family)